MEALASSGPQGTSQLRYEHPHAAGSRSWNREPPEAAAAAAARAYLYCGSGQIRPSARLPGSSMACLAGLVGDFCMHIGLGPLLWLWHAAWTWRK